jgi:uncharacterized small protein (DUF1192 family)
MTIGPTLPTRDDDDATCMNSEHGGHPTCPHMEQVLADLRAEVARLKDACLKMNDEVSQTLGKALGYPWFKDDQQNFPGATEANGVCVGEHVAESIAAEAAGRITHLTEELSDLRAELVGAKGDALAADQRAEQAEAQLAEHGVGECERNYRALLTVHQELEGRLRALSNG